LEQCLVPTLIPGDIVVMDNLSSGNNAQVFEAESVFGDVGDLKSPDF
jgi:hypothetical protein